MKHYRKRRRSMRRWNGSYGLEIYSPYQDLELPERMVYDCGDLELPTGDSEQTLMEIEKTARRVLDDGKLPFMIGGEHLVTLGSVRAAAEKYPELHIIHFDAHTDLRKDYLGVELSHACVMRRCWELLGDGKIHQFGIRSGEKEEFQWAGRGHTDLHLYNLKGLETTIKSLGNRPVYFSVDLDVMDPSVFPGTGTPEPGGIDFLAAMQGVTEVCTKVNLVGCDVNELCPPHDQTGASTAVACKIIREMLIAVAEKSSVSGSDNHGCMSGGRRTLYRYGKL